MLMTSSFTIALTCDVYNIPYDVHLLGRPTGDPGQDPGDDTELAELVILLFSFDIVSSLHRLHKLCVREDSFIIINST